MKTMIVTGRTWGLAVAVLAALQFHAWTAEPELPPGVFIRSENKAYVHADISDLRVGDYPALANIHALFTVYYDGPGATDEKLKALAQLRFTNLACVVFTDCPLVTDRGIEHLSQIPTLVRLGLRQMSITDASCDKMVQTMRLAGVYMPN